MRHGIPHHGTGARFGQPTLHYAGAPILHGYAYQSGGAQGMGGAARAAAAAAPLPRAGFPDNVRFFVWLVIIGIIIPGLIIGGLKAGRFQFVFRGR